MKMEIQFSTQFACSPCLTSSCSVAAEMLCTLKFSDFPADMISLSPLFLCSVSVKSSEKEPSIFTNSSRVCLDEPTNPTDSEECRLAVRFIPLHVCLSVSLCFLPYLHLSVHLSFLACLSAHRLDLLCHTQSSAS